MSKYSDATWKSGVARALKLMLLALLISIFVYAQPVVVIGDDLTGSMGSVGYDGVSELDKNLAAVCGIISALPPGTSFTVAAITDVSFRQPFVLSQGRIPRSKGQLKFLDQIAAAKDRIKARVRGSAVNGEFPYSDILGFILFAADRFALEQGQSKALIILSDMHENTKGGLDFDNPDSIDTAAALNFVEQHKLVADLRGVDVFVFGASGKSPSYWRSLRDFWTTYFKKSGANLRTFSMSRDVPVLPAPRQ